MLSSLSSRSSTSSTLLTLLLLLSYSKFWMCVSLVNSTRICDPKIRLLRQFQSDWVFRIFSCAWVNQRRSHPRESGWEAICNLPLWALQRDFLQIERVQSGWSRIKKCGHYFHIQCISDWLSGHKHCPLDRREAWVSLTHSISIGLRVKSVIIILGFKEKVMENKGQIIRILSTS